MGSGAGAVSISSFEDKWGAGHSPSRRERSVVARVLIPVPVPLAGLPSGPGPGPGSGSGSVGGSPFRPPFRFRFRLQVRVPVSRWPDWSTGGSPEWEPCGHHQHHLDSTTVPSAPVRSERWSSRAMIRCCSLRASASRTTSLCFSAPRHDPSPHHITIATGKYPRVECASWTCR